MKNRLKEWLRILKGFKRINKYNNYKRKKKIIYLLKPEHGNMGDQAIAYATKMFYEKYFNEYVILEFDRDKVYSEYLAIKKCINKDDIIVLHGGGNMGNLYPPEEDARRFVIRKFKNNPIISMTQTISFIKDSNEKEEEEKISKAYNKHKKLLLLAREDKSYDKMKELFNCDIIKVPDIVLFLSNKLGCNEKRIMITTCLRDDKESMLLNKKEIFINKLKDDYDNVFVYDTNLNRSLDIDERNLELEKMWDNFKKSKVVITDRLHGMIFCVITKTPCIALKSLDHKVTESYKWIESLDFIELVDDLEYTTLKPIIKKFENIKVKNNIDYDKEYFFELSVKIKEFLKKSE